MPEGASTGLILVPVRNGKTDRRRRADLAPLPEQAIVGQWRAIDV
jgi:hypothetical protein